MSKKKTKLKVKELHFNAYDIIGRAVEEGVRYALNRRLTEKLGYLDLPPEKMEAAEEEIYNSVINSLCEVIDFNRGE